ncbi:hypothetical protein BJ912DRAFT_458168 [Pholiota molesta]|nr:hypothetical protein BJ912DRAFT_458168 [Pholiota molesta]
MQNKQSRADIITDEQSRKPVPPTPSYESGFTRHDSAQDMRQMGMPFAPQNGTPCPPAAPQDYYLNNYGVNNTYNGYAHPVDGLGSVSPTYSANLAQDHSVTEPAYESGYTSQATLAPQTGAYPPPAPNYPYPTANEDGANTYHHPQQANGFGSMRPAHSQNTAEERSVTGPGRSTPFHERGLSGQNKKFNHAATAGKRKHSGNDNDVVENDHSQSTKDQSRKKAKTAPSTQEKCDAAKPEKKKKCSPPKKRVPNLSIPFIDNTPGPSTISPRNGMSTDPRHHGPSQSDPFSNKKEDYELWDPIPHVPDLPKRKGKDGAIKMIPIAYKRQEVDDKQKKEKPTHEKRAAENWSDGLRIKPESCTLRWNRNIDTISRRRMAGVPRVV